MKKNIQNKKLPLWLAPVRFAYRLFTKVVRSNVLLKQVNIGEIKYLVWVNEDIGKKLLYLRRFENAETKVFKQHLMEGGVCLDIGGNIGYYSLNMSKYVGNTGRVYVFEPIKRNWLLIQLALEINDFSDNTQVYCEAATNYDGEVLIDEPEDGAYAHIATTVNKAGNKVPCRKIDTFVAENNLTQIDAVKIDVEGAELLVLKGATATLESLQPKLIMVELVTQYLDRFNSTISEVVSFMARYGYAPYVATPSGDLEPFTQNLQDKIFNVFFKVR